MLTLWSLILGRVKIKLKPMKQKHFEDQLDDEEVLYVFRKHPIVMRKGLVFGSFALLIGPLFTLILLYVRPNDPPSMGFFGLSLVLSIVLMVIVMFPYWITWYFSVFIITDQRFIQISQKGLFNKSIVDLSLKQIQSMNYEIKGIQETLLGYGTILLQTYMGDLVIHELHHPAKIYKKLVTILRDKGITPDVMQTDSSETTDEEQD